MTHGTGVLAGGLMLIITACYRPVAITECSVNCESSACPSGFSCGADQLCFRQGASACSDAGSDTPFDPDAKGNDGLVPPSEVCPGHPLFAGRCVIPTAGTLTLSGPDLSTDTDSRCAPIGAMGSTAAWCVIAYEHIEVAEPVRAFGTRALVLIAGQTLTIGADGVLDVSSYATKPGASANYSGCNTTQTVGTGSATGGGGGSGGSFRGSGGAGGNGTSGTIGGGTSLGGQPASSVRGGCRGGNGGAGDLTAEVGRGGFGGGALLLHAELALSIAGELGASGAPGQGGTLRSGGGGAGSGGMIVLSSPAVTVATNGVVHALGGGGATGSTDAAVGIDGTTPLGGMPAAARTAPARAGTGGAGNPGNDSNNGSSGGQGIEGGGGGGGGGGWIIITGDSSPLITGVVTPYP